eukprot:CAMPEP_0181310618 /NCGR_PEP_ID=MMETSP1101-20121128/12685_1 /TAXON_ID=46948 /ORGANISM="Rhodomonas abbreviata, Strain Caron Lab Isolate" /LENGTH=331 /DNA_ID=CAMNT_0023417265 /DNA_START=147 /DNA_END=1142 /DNA_ORIENTATION=+
MEDFLRPVEDQAGIRECFEQYGAVGITGVLSTADCQAVITGIEQFLPRGCKVMDPQTHELADSEGAFNRYGVIGKEPLFNSAILRARLHPRVVAAYRALYGDVPLIACHDRAAWMRPTFNNAAFDTPANYPGLHLDVSPTSYFGEASHRKAVDAFLNNLTYSRLGDFTAENNAKHETQGLCVQGVLSLLDNEEEDGGFHFLPGAHKETLRAWTHDQARADSCWSPPEANGRYFFSRRKGDMALLAAHGGRPVRLPCPAGTLILFDAALPHGTAPNSSACSRLILFLRYMTPPQLPAEAWRQRNEALRKVVKEVGFEPDAREAAHLYYSLQR